MIFACVGTQLPFPRLMDTLDALAPVLPEKIVAQTGSVAAQYHSMETHDFMPPDIFERAFARARVIVSHAGIGTILAAQRLRKPLILMARRAELGEHRDDHQVATERALEGRDGLYFVRTPADLHQHLVQHALKPACRSNASSPLVSYVAAWIAAGEARP